MNTKLLNKLLTEYISVEKEIQSLENILQGKRDLILQLMKDTNSYIGNGVQVTKVENVRYQFDEELAVKLFTPKMIEFCKEIKLTKAKMDAAIKGRLLTMDLCERIMHKVVNGFRLSIKY